MHRNQKKWSRVNCTANDRVVDRVDDEGLSVVVVPRMREISLVVGPCYAVAALITSYIKIKKNFISRGKIDFANN